MEIILIKEKLNKRLILITGDGKDYYLVKVYDKTKKKYATYKKANDYFNTI